MNLKTTIYSIKNTPLEITSEGEAKVVFNKSQHEVILQALEDLEKLRGLKRTPKGLRTTTSGSLNEIVYSFSVYNAGATNGVIQGIVIKPGERLHWGAGAVNNFYEEGEIVYDATGTELLIIYNA